MNTITPGESSVYGDTIISIIMALYAKRLTNSPDAAQAESELFTSFALSGAKWRQLFAAYF